MRPELPNAPHAYHLTSRKQWRQLWRAVRRKDVTGAYCSTRHGIIVSKHSGCMSVHTLPRTMVAALLSTLMTRRFEMGNATYRHFIVTARDLRTGRN